MSRATSIPGRRFTLAARSSARGLIWKLCMAATCDVGQGGSRHEAMFASVQIWLPSGHSGGTKVGRRLCLQLGPEATAFSLYEYLWVRAASPDAVKILHDLRCLFTLFAYLWQAPCCPVRVTNVLPMRSDVVREERKKNKMRPCWSYTEKPMLPQCLLYV